MKPSGNICSSCKQPLVNATALGGLCPACLLKSGFYSGTAPESPVPKFAAPSVEVLAIHFPHLEIIELIGRGGMGAVYKARQPKLNRLVALKILAREGDSDERFTERFEREAQALARMNHPNIVTVYDFGEVEGNYYLLMEFVDGMNLRQLEHANNLPPEVALTIVPQICDALQYAHNQGIVHRDIKPENILLDKDGRVKIADFGIAKILVAGSAPEEPLTKENQRVGTAHYMAPEQFEKPTSVDHRADIYSLGVVFYEMLTGELPLGKFAPPSRKVQIDVRLDEVVLRALEKEPELRFQNAREIKTRVETIATGVADAAGGAGQEQKTELPEKSQMVQIVEVVSGMKFSSPGAIMAINASAGGFLGFLGFLGFVTVPPTRPLFALFGLFGLFGWLGAAFLIEFQERRRQAKSQSGTVAGTDPGEDERGLVRALPTVVMAFAALAFLLAAIHWADNKSGVNFVLSLAAAAGFAVATAKRWPRPRAGKSVGSSQPEDESPNLRRRRLALLWYGFTASLIGLPIGILLQNPLVVGLSITGIVTGGIKLSWQRDNTGPSFSTEPSSTGHLSRKTSPPVNAFPKSTPNTALATVVFFVILGLGFLGIELLKLGRQTEFRAAIGWLFASVALLPLIILWSRHLAGRWQSTDSMTGRPAGRLWLLTFGYLGWLLALFAWTFLALLCLAIYFKGFESTVKGSAAYVALVLYMGGAILLPMAATQLIRSATGEPEARRKNKLGIYAAVGLILLLTLIGVNWMHSTLRRGEITQQAPKTWELQRQTVAQEEHAASLASKPLAGEALPVTTVNYSDFEVPTKVADELEDAEALSATTTVPTSLRDELPATAPRHRTRAELIAQVSAPGDEVTTLNLRLSPETTLIKQVPISLGQSAMNIVRRCHPAPPAADDDPWITYAAADGGSYWLHFLPEDGESPDPTSDPLYAVVHYATQQANDGKFLLPKAMQDTRCGEYQVLRVALNSGSTRTALAALGMSPGDIMSFFTPATDAAPEEEVIRFKTAGNGWYKLDFSHSSGGGAERGRNTLKLTRIEFHGENTTEPHVLLSASAKTDDSAAAQYPSKVGVNNASTASAHPDQETEQSLEPGADALHFDFPGQTGPQSRRSAFHTFT